MKNSLYQNLVSWPPIWGVVCTSLQRKIPTSQLNQNMWPPASKAFLTNGDRILSDEHHRLILVRLNSGVSARHEYLLVLITRDAKLVKKW